MRQCLENFPFSLEPFGEAAVTHEHVGKLQRQRAAHASIAPNREPHRAHSTVTDLTNQPIRTHLRAFAPGDRILDTLAGGDDVAIVQLQRSEFVQRGREIDVLGQQMAQLLGQMGRVERHLGEKCRPLVVRQLEQSVEQSE